MVLLQVAGLSYLTEVGWVVLFRTGSPLERVKGNLKPKPECQ